MADEPRAISEPAFPSNFGNWRHGMTLRDWFAGQALAGLLACPDINVGGGLRHEYAARAYEFADAMLAAREQGGT